MEKNEKSFKEKNFKEKIEDLAFYSAIAILAVIVWYVSYNFGIEYYRGNQTPVGQEYLVKDIIVGPNSTFWINYYDNDNNKTEKTLIPTGFITINLTKSNSTESIVRLEKIDNGIQYWNIYMGINKSYKNMTQIKKGDNKKVV